MGGKVEGKLSKLVALARDLASQRTDTGLDKAAEILLHLIDEGANDPEILIRAANYLLQGSHSGEYETKEKAIALVDQAVALTTDSISILENAVHCYELTLNSFPDKMSDIIRLCLQILELDPDHIESMIILSYHREHPGVALGLEDAIRMLEWAKEVDPGNKFVDFTLARLYMEAGQKTQAKKLYQQVISDRPGSIEANDALLQIKSLQSRTKNKKFRKYGVN